MDTLDVSAGELSAIVDFTNQVDVRTAAEFLVAPSGDCMLCGRLDSIRPLATVQHLYSKDHRMRTAQYRICQQSLLIHERSALDGRQGCASRREVVLIYLGHRLARTDLISHGMKDYNYTAVNYLLRRASASELMRVFSMIEGREHDSSRGLCSICLERPSTVLFESCKHLCACRLCLVKLKANRQPGSGDDDDAADDKVPCPICRDLSDVSSVFIV